MFQRKLFQNNILKKTLGPHKQEERPKAPLRSLLHQRNYKDLSYSDCGNSHHTICQDLQDSLTRRLNDLHQCNLDLKITVILSDEEFARWVQNKPPITLSTVNRARPAATTTCHFGGAYSLYT